MKTYKTQQEDFWAGDFGNEYIERNRDEKTIVTSNTALFAKILSRTPDIQSVIEFGANIGLNLRAIRNLRPEVQMSAIEINQKAIKELQQIKDLQIYNMSILDFSPDQQRDFVFTKTVLIHINPEKLAKVYDLLYQTSRRYICLVEYYNPTPVSVLYRGHENRLFKRDFAGELLDRYPQLRLIDYGFVYHRDTFPQDDVNWFLLEKPVGDEANRRI